MRCTHTFNISTVYYYKGKIYPISEVMALPVRYHQYFKEVSNCKHIGDIYVK